MEHKLGSVAGPVIQANGSFEDELRSGGMIYCVSQQTELVLMTAWSLWGTQEWLVLEKG